jgi:hypothetical protein
MQYSKEKHSKEEHTDERRDRNNEQLCENMVNVQTTLQNPASPRYMRHL